MSLSNSYLGLGLPTLAWVLMALTLGLGLFLMFIFGDDLLNAGKIVWDFVRWLSSPII